MRVNIKNMPKLNLLSLLKRRKSTLKKFIDEAGIQSYVSLVDTCDVLGVQPPTEHEYTQLFPQQVTSHQDGIIVLGDIDPVIHENIKEKIVSQLTKKRKKKTSSDLDEKVCNSCGENNAWLNDKFYCCNRNCKEYMSSYPND